MKNTVYFLICILLSIPSLAQENNYPAFLTDSLDNYIEKGMKDWQIPGLAIAIVKNNEPIYVKGFGVRDLESQRPVDENTLFMIGSNTKAFTATALAILQERTDFKLTDKVKTWMPEFRLKDELATREVNVVDLLSHRIGFNTFQGDFTYWTSTLSRKDVIQKMQTLDIPKGFRGSWGYSNAAFVTAGELIPRIIGKSWERTIKDSILMPLQMYDTKVLSNDLKNDSNHATPYTLVDGQLRELPVPDVDNLGPAGSMSSNVTDMTHWLMAQIDNGKLFGEQKLPKNSLRAIKRPAYIMGIDTREGQATRFNVYGLGIGINDRNGKLVYSHLGGVDGFLSTVMIVPEEKLGIVVLTNSDKNNFFINLAEIVRDAFLGLPFEDFSHMALQQFRKGNQAAKKELDSLRALVNKKLPTSLDPKAYLGTYKNDVYGTIEVKDFQGNLSIFFENHPDLVGKLEHIKDDVFLCEYSNPSMGIVKIPFQVTHNKVTGLTLRVTPNIEFTPYEFTKLKQ